MSEPTKDHARVSPEGRAMGQQMVRLAEPWIGALARTGEPDERCKSCAFRAGTVPNGCLQTQMDVLKAVIERTPFLCHQQDRKGLPCHGWFAAQVAIHHNEKTKGPMPVKTCPWEFSPADDAEGDAS